MYVYALSCFWPNVRSWAEICVFSERMAPLFDVSSFVGHGRAIPESVGITSAPAAMTPP